MSLNFEACPKTVQDEVNRILSLPIRDQCQIRDEIFRKAKHHQQITRAEKTFLARWRQKDFAMNQGHWQHERRKYLCGNVVGGMQKV